MQPCALPGVLVRMDSIQPSQIVRNQFRNAFGPHVDRLEYALDANMLLCRGACIRFESGITKKELTG